MAVVIDRDQCNACGSCVEVCATDALALTDGQLTVLEDSCIDCNQCVDECPNEALAPAAHRCPAPARPRTAMDRDAP